MIVCRSSIRVCIELQTRAYILEPQINYNLFSELSDTHLEETVYLSPSPSIYLLLKPTDDGRTENMICCPPWKRRRWFVSKLFKIELFIFSPMKAAWQAEEEDVHASTSTTRPDDPLADDLCDIIYLAFNWFEETIKMILILSFPLNDRENWSCNCMIVLHFPTPCATLIVIPPG